ncbi:ninja-family protein [Canna indica]|uniref:Ninja-family protein n=1 Tax=Canna indica TaxID=4628 RepID=A0AAQ3KL59_9LILI|nr:ninja-family protein [Canna indica]
MYCIDKYRVMEDENDLELSLGLSFGGSSGKSKARNIPSDSKVEEGCTSQSVGRDVADSDVPFKNFFQNSVGNQEQNGKQAVSPPQENYWTDSAKCNTPTTNGYDVKKNSQSQLTKHKELSIANNRTAEIREDKSGLKKRRLASEETKFQNKQEKAVDRAELVCKSPVDVTFMKQPRLSVATDDGSTGENEGVAESEAEVSSSWLISQHADITKPSDLPKGTTPKHALSDQTVTGFQGQKQQNNSGNISSELGKVTYGTPVSLQPPTVSMVPYPAPAKVAIVGAPIATSSPSPCVVQPIASSKDDRPIVQGTNVDGQNLVFGYSSVQLPTLETNSSWAFSSYPQAISSLALSTPNTLLVEDGTKMSIVPVQIHLSTTLGYEKTLATLAGSVKGNGKHIMETETSSTSGTEEGKGISTVSRQKEIANPHVIEGFDHDGSLIKPCIAPHLKFRGSGSYPDLPWVSTTGPGPKGRTISGVTYKYNKNQIKIVCACHGSHMSPEEFIQHAYADAINPEKNTSLTSFTSSPSGSAKN